MTIGLRDVAALRLRNQRVVGEKFASAAEVVSWLGCVQAQEYRLAKWSIGMRTWPNLHDADVDAALTRGEILRTHILRPTWHFVTPADIRWITRLTGPRVLAGSGARIRFLGLEGARMSASLDVVMRALEGGKQLTRAELQEALAVAGLPADNSQMTYIAMAAEMTCLVASGAPRTGKQTYALLDEWAPPTARDREPFDRERAVAELVLRFFTSHGPATIGDFTWWSGINGADTKRGIAANGSALQSLEVDGEKFWWAGDAGGSADSPASPAVYLMQAFDEYVVAYKSPRTPINLAGLTSSSVLQRPPFSHGVFVDTQIVGFWRRTTAGAGFRIDVSLLRALSPAERSALDEEASRYSEFVERPIKLVAASA